MPHEQIQYIEFLSKDLQAIRQFYIDCFGWTFTDWGPEYISFDGEHVSGGFASGAPVQGSMLVILYSQRLEETLEKVRAAGGGIVKEIFSFPGGRDFILLIQMAMSLLFGLTGENQKSNGKSQIYK